MSVSGEAIEVQPFIFGAFLPKLINCTIATAIFILAAPSTLHSK